MAVATGAALCRCGGDAAACVDVEALQPVPFQQVTLEDDFWLPRLKTQKHTLVPFALGKTEPAVENLKRTGAYLRGEKTEPLLPLPRYVASDLFKVMEGAAYLLTIEPDAELECRMDEIIDIIVAAQAPDGYLYEPHIMGTAMVNGADGGTGDKPYSWVVHSHELYNMGHMYEAAVAYYQATGKRKWLDAAEKSARHINHVFFEGDPAYNGGKPVNQAPGHQEIELALVKLFRVTGDSLYLGMARRFLDIRGVTYRPDGDGVMAPDYAQQHMPVREQRTAVGHAVRATYMYSAMADVGALTGDTTLRPALDAIWHDIVDRKMHITGGLGAVPGIEGFGPDYVLPNKNTYDETCAGVGNVFFNYRLFQLERDARYVDVAEVALYNNVLAGVNLAGDRFFYVNPLEADGRKAFNQGHRGRSPWFGTACCPSNLARLIPQVPGMVYSQTDDEVFCALYAGCSTTLHLECGDVGLTQRTDYPFSGDVEIEVDPASDGAEFTLWLRVPTWCTGEGFVPGDLYRYDDGIACKAEVKVNGRRIRERAVRGFIPVRREWRTGDRVSLSLPMPVRSSAADERVEDDADRRCITRGPLVYCAETADNEFPVNEYFIGGGSVDADSVYLAPDGVLKGIAVARVAAEAVDGDGTRSAELTLIPYYAWDNRGDDAMNVWFARSEETARASAFRFARNISGVAASFTYANDDVYAIADGQLPDNSYDTTIPRWTSWPETGREQQVEVKLAKPMEVESVAVYWYDDNGGVQVPVSWSMEYRSQGEWHEYRPYTTDRFGVERDQFNMVHPDETVSADALRLRIVPRNDAAVGILELEVN